MGSEGKLPFAGSVRDFVPRMHGVFIQQALRAVGSGGRYCRGLSQRGIYAKDYH